MTGVGLVSEVTAVAQRTVGGSWNWWFSGLAAGSVGSLTPLEARGSGGCGAFEPVIHVSSSPSLPSPKVGSREEPVIVKSGQG